jgi:hypothetical protein
MSYDFALEKVCSHEVKLETVSLIADSDDSIRFPKNPSNSNVTVWMDGMFVPPSGIWSVPELPLSRIEPYRIVSGVSDMLYVQVGSGMSRLIQMISGNNVKAFDLAKDLSLKIPELSITSSNGRVFFKSPISGPSAVSFSFPDPRWTDRTSSLPTTHRVLAGYTQIGIIPGRKVVSRRTFPSWNIIDDDLTLVAGGNGKLIKFSEPIRNSSPTFQIGYFTIPSNCRRCHGIQIEFDYSPLNGSYETVTDSDLLAQEFGKFLFTRAGSHFKWPWLGSRLTDRIGGKNITGGVSASSLITLDISQTFKTYQNIKMQQDQQFPFQEVSDAEFPYSLGSLTVQVPDEDPTVAVVVTGITSRSREPVVLKRLIGNPNPFFLSSGGKSFRIV